MYTIETDHKCVCIWRMRKTIMASDKFGLKFWICFLYFILSVHGCWHSKPSQISKKNSGTSLNKIFSNKNSFPNFKTSQDKISVQENNFVDSNGRVHIFHGMNAVDKGPPWFPAWLLNDTKLEYLTQWGFNVVRLGTMWSGVNPAQNVTNNTYLAILENIITKLDRNGIYVILDLHQDVLSSYYETYDGVPRWLVDKLPPPPHPFPWPLTRVTSWAAGYLSQAAGKTMQHIYNNTDGARDDLATFWSTVSRRFKDFSNVLGYEIINEPWCGDIYSSPSYLLPGNAGRYNLQPLYDVMNDVIRKEDNVTIIFYEPVTWGVVFNGTHSGTGFTAVPGGQEFVNRSALSYHYYCWIIASSDDHKVYPFLKKEICDHILGPRVFRTAIQDAKTTGGGMFLTEFGLCAPDGKKNSTDTVECEFVLTQADVHLQSWAYWDSFFFFYNGSVDWTIVTPFARPYARAIAGTPKNMTFDLDSGVFQFQYVPMHGSAFETEIFVPSLHYPNGFSISKSSGVTTSFDYEKRILYVKYEGNGSVVDIVLTPK